MPPQVVVYAGEGCSHSWTWLADLFEANPVQSIRFLDGHDFIRSLGEAPSTVIVSGGDAYAIASSLAGKGFHELRGYIDSGGEYVGLCAGAYLPLPTSMPPLNDFNICSVKIENVLGKGAGPKVDSPREGVPYCDKLVIHPVRGEVMLGFGGKTVTAPVFGGPIFKEPSEGRVVGRFIGFVASTEFQIPVDDARGMVVGRPAVVEARYGMGRLLLLSPHLEHPGFTEANRVFVELLRVGDGRSRLDKESSSLRRFRSSALSKAAADLSVALRGLEGASFLVGSKLWDVERLMVLADAIRKRARRLPASVADDIAPRVRSVRDMVVDSRSDDSESMDALLSPLMSAARDCVNLTFEHSSLGR